MGTAASSPVAPPLTRTSDVWELSLARIYVSANTVNIVKDNISDERFETDLCGLINPKLGLDPSAWQRRFDEFLEAIKAQDKAFLIEQKELFDRQLLKQQTEFQGWYGGINNDIAKLQSFNFDNLAALYKVTRETIRSPDRRTATEIIKSTFTGVKIAERVTTRGADKITATQVTRVFAQDGVSVFKEATVVVVRNADGSFTETANGFNDYSLTPAYFAIVDSSDMYSSKFVSYENPKYPEVSTAQEGLDIALTAVKEIGWNG